MNLYENIIKNNHTETPSPYVPVMGTVERVTRVTEHERLFVIAPSNKELLNYCPGQFYMVGLPGYGEAPISITSGPGQEKEFELCIRAVGNVTNALHRLRKGDTVFIRGPFGTGFNLEEMKGKDILFVAGGIGIVPMRSLIKAVLNDTKSYGRLSLIYGSRNPDDILYREEFEEWKAKGLDMRLTVDKPHPTWKGNVGVVTTLIPKIDVDPARTIGVIIGPPVMYKFVILSFRNKKITDDKIFVSLERRMKCGVGKCGHCQINSSYVCQEGPVYRLKDLHGLPEAI